MIKRVGTADQWDRGTATRQPITWICSPGVVEFVRSNLAPDFPLFHAVCSMQFKLRKLSSNQSALFPLKGTDSEGHF